MDHFRFELAGNSIHKECMIQFRQANPNDAPHITAFQIAMAFETEKLRLDEATCQKGVRAVFEDPSKGTYHICTNGDHVIGCLLLTSEWSDWRNGKVWWIQSVYFLPEYRRQKLFSKFYTYIQELAHAQPEIRGIRLYVDKTNEIAQKVYAKIGMNGEHYKLFEWMKTF